MPDKSGHRSRVRARRSNPPDGGTRFLAKSMPRFPWRSYGGSLDHNSVKSPSAQACVRSPGGTTYGLMAWVRTLAVSRVRVIMRETLGENAPSPNRSGTDVF